MLNLKELYFAMCIRCFLIYWLITHFVTHFVTHFLFYNFLAMVLLLFTHNTLQYSSRVAVVDTYNKFYCIWYLLRNKRKTDHLPFSNFITDLLTIINWMSPLEKSGKTHQNNIDNELPPEYLMGLVRSTRDYKMTR